MHGARLDIFVGGSMRKVAAFIATIMALSVAPAEAATSPDYKLKCKNGKVSKVWLNPLKIVNNCGTHSKQWVTVRLWNPSGSADPSTVSADIYSVHPGATYDSTTKQGELARHGGWEIGLTTEKTAVLDRGVFCNSGYEDHQPNVFYHEERAYGTVIVYVADDFHSRTKIINIYSKRSSWRPDCG